jgi:phage terminase Nu1 subunit (DNA packaging protein)
MTAVDVEEVREQVRRLELVAEQDAEELDELRQCAEVRLQVVQTSFCSLCWSLGNIAGHISRGTVVKSII